MRISWQVAAAFVVGVLATAVLIGQRRDGSAVLPSAEAQAEGDSRPSHLAQTSGSATVNVKPDSARVFFKITKRASKLADVRAEAARSANEVMKQLAALGIERMFTKTSTVNVRVLWEREEDMQARGYEMANAFTVRVVDQDVDQLAKSAARVVDVGLGAGANEIEQITFFKEDDSAERRECLKQAIHAGRANAEAIAEAAGVRLMGPVSLSGRPDYSYWSPMMNNVQMVQAAAPSGGSDEASAFTPGDVQIKCNADVSYEFAPK